MRPASDPPETRGWAALAAIVALSVLLLLPALRDAGAMTGDSYIAYRWQGHFATAFWQGNLYPRWLPDLNFGLGSPVFFIYPPFSQWLPALLDPVWPGPAEAGARMVAVLLVARIAGGWGVLRWLEALGVSRAGALLGAALYLLLPYHAFMDTYQRAACAELLGMAVLPWGMVAGHAIRDGRRHAAAGFALAIAALLYSHAPTALFGVPFLCLYTVTIARRGDGLRVWTATALGGALGVGLAAAYLGPALTQIGMINSAHLFNSIYKPTNYLFFSAVRWPDPGIEGAAMICLVVHLGALGLFATLAARVRPIDAGARTFMLVAFAIILVLMTAPTRPLWRDEMPWAKIQFAWRMLTLHTLLLAGLGAMAWDAAPAGRFAKRGRLLLILLLPSLFLVDLGMVGVRWWRAAHRTEAWPPPFLTDYGRDVDEYWLGDLRYAQGFGPRAKAESPGTRITTPVWRSRAVSLDVVAPVPTRILIRQYAYSGWTMRIDGGAWRPAARLPAPYNIVVAPVPAGRHRVDLAMPPLAPERIGTQITWGSIGLLALLLIGGIARRRTALVRNRSASI